MMSLQKRITEDLVLALKSHRNFEVRVLRMLQAAVINKQKEKRYRIGKEKPELVDGELKEQSRLSDDELIKLVLSEVKKRREAVLEFEKGERRDLAEKERKEMEILQKYLPEQLSDEDIKELVKGTIKKIGARDLKDIGRIMADLIPRVKGKADGARVSKIIKELLT